MEPTKAEKGRAIRDYYNFMRYTLDPKNQVEMDVAEFNRLRERLIKYGVDPDHAAQAMFDEDAKFKKGMFFWKVAFSVAGSAALIYAML